MPYTDRTYTRSSLMRAPKGHPVHQWAPKEWRHVPDLTGSYELDGTIQRNPNKDLKSRLEFYLDSSQTVYGAKSAYSGYHGYSGDD